MQVSKFPYQGFRIVTYLSMKGAGFMAEVYSFKHHVIVDKIATIVIFSM